MLSEPPFNTIEQSEQTVSTKIHEFNVQEKLELLTKLSQNEIQDLLESIFTFQTQQNPESSDTSKATTPETKKLHDNTMLIKLDPADMSRNIYDYYNKTHRNKLRQILIDKKIPENELDTALENTLLILSKKYIDKFKESVKAKLSENELAEENFEDFWQWRIAHPPHSTPTLMSDADNIYIQYDDFVSQEAIEQFISQKNHQNPHTKTFINSSEIDQLLTEAIQGSK